MTLSRKIGRAANREGNSRVIFCVCAFLVVAVWIVFGQVPGFEFVNYDDNSYVQDNPVVIQGLNLKGIEWAFTHSVAANWHPLTVISFMLDCQLYGLHPAGYHLTNLLLYTATVILLFLALRDMTGVLWRSAFVAAIFAIHPLHVESVAWVSERKDVLSGLFFVLTIWTYIRYVRNPWSLSRYLMVFFLFALGLMCKPMLVTVPFLLMLLDYWPLNRFGASGSHVPIWKKGIIEQIPFVAISIAVCMATLLVQHQVNEFPLLLRINNALVSYVAYCAQMFYPVGLAIPYPYPIHGLPIGEIILALFLLITASTAAIYLRHKHPFCFVGWFWYLGMLVPVIGLVQVGDQARADRYTYLPQIGLYILLTWMVAELTVSWRNRRWLLGAGATAILVALITSARAQTACWRNSESLWTHTLECTSDNGVAHNELGNALFQKGQMDRAMTQFQEAVAINPDDANFQYNLGEAFRRLGKDNEAISQFQKALAIDPKLAEAHYDLGNAYFRLGNMADTISEYQMALAIKPDYLEARNNLAFVFATCTPASLRNGNEAVKLAESANQLAGGKNPVILYTLSAAYAEAGRFPEAIGTGQRALQLATVQSNFALVESLQSQLKTYQARVPSENPERAH